MNEIKTLIINDQLNVKLSKLETVISIRYLCSKVADNDKIINIERALEILPYRVRLSSNYLKTMNYLDMKFVLKGLRSFFFDNALNNPSFSYKKLQQILVKIALKIKIIQNFLALKEFRY